MGVVYDPLPVQHCSKKIMEAVLWLLLAGIVAVLLVVANFIQRHFTSKTGQNGESEAPVVATAVVAGGVRRPQSRNVRARVAALRRARGEEGPVGGANQDGSEEEDGGRYVEKLVEEMVEKEEKKAGKVGTKKLKRIQEKAERKATREQDEAQREDHKHREALREEERKKEAEEEKLKQAKEEEEERERKEEQERKEQEEYLQLKESFVVEEEGLDVKDDETETRGVTDFVNYIKKVKVVYMEDLAAEFDLKTQEAISRVQSLQESGQLSGVVDDRGKFIFISDEELKAVADFIKQRGRVSISELVSSSNRLVNLQPEPSTLTTS